MINYKKIAAVAAAAALTAASQTGVSVLGFYEGEETSSVTKDDNDASQDIAVTASNYFGHGETEYSVEIKWGSMKWQYISDYAWDPEILQYRTESYYSGQKWIHYGNNDNLIHITNRSNTRIFADAEFTGKTTEDDPAITEDIIGDIYNSNNPQDWTRGSDGAIMSDAAKGIDPGDTSKQGRESISDFWLGITDGALAGSAKDVEIGTITVTIKDYGREPKPEA